jgi:signal transduction histidine kinase
VKHIRYKFILVVSSLIAIWIISAWFISDNFYLARKNKVVEQQTRLSQERANDLADSIHRNLIYIAGIPDLLAPTVRVKNAVTLFGTNSIPSPLPLEVRKARWTNDPALKELSLYLRQVQGDLHVNLIYVVNAAGDCIAAGNLNTPGTSIGTNFAERDFFLANKNNKRGMQFAVGKTTHIPGLFFGSPIFIKGRFMGAVAAKMDVPNMTSLIEQVSAFVTDSNGVIILAQNKEREMLSLPAAPIAAISEKERMDRYRKTDFSVLPIEPWGDKNFSSLMRVQNSADPHILVSREIADYGMKAYVDTNVDEIRALNRDESWFAFLLGMSGTVLILIAGGAVLYVDSVRAEEIALGRAGIAEHRIITVSEETMRRIGGELHDDLGQHLTGTAFKSTLLFDSLKKHGYAECKEAAEITALINEAINKTRRFAQGLYPVEMKHAGLPALLEQLAANVTSTYHVECEFHINGECSISDPLVLINLFRIAQEAVNNAIKHSGATKITLAMETTPSGLTLEISDNGSGIGEQEVLDEMKGLGMYTMSYRASLLGGFFRITERTSGGTSVFISVPAAG